MREEEVKGGKKGKKERHILKRKSRSRRTRTRRNGEEIQGK